MISLSLKQKIIAGIVTAAVVLFAGVFALESYQPLTKADKIYEQALQDFRNEKYSNSYYLFSKVSFFSNLKPPAIFHQAECAQKLGDKDAALKQYTFLFKHYPHHKLSAKAQYSAAQLIVETKPELAQKYFDQISDKYPETDYAIASEYYSGLILKNSNKDGAQDHFRDYIIKSPSGRLAMSAVENWLALDTLDTPDQKITNDDYLLMAKTCYLFGDYNKTGYLLFLTSPEKSWALDVKNRYAFKEYEKAKTVAETGLSKYSKNVDEQDIYDVIDIYLSISPSKEAAINKLLGISARGKDYLLSLKCKTATDKEACYTNLYKKYPDGNFSADALANIFFERIRKNEDAAKVGKEHLKKFPNSNSAPMVMYWLAKITKTAGSTDYFKEIILKYPDSYYAYRAYLQLEGKTSPIIADTLAEKPVVYPYKHADSLITKLVELNDYDIVSELCKDGFVKSWVMYRKGDYASSAWEAQKAMDELSIKPDKYDFRWRLVYPLNYYETVNKYAAAAGNNAPLIQSIMREESHFDPKVQSSVGARGLMQLMPATAAEVAQIYGLSSAKNLANPDVNIKLGNYYYGFLKSKLGYDISSIAAYNGGIGSLQRWKSTLEYKDTDEFIEQIPYPETQNYVKKVLRSYWNYVRIYE